MTEHWLLTDFIYLNLVKYQVFPKPKHVCVIATLNLAVFCNQNKVQVDADILAPS
jgi:hypothetical protein